MPNIALAMPANAPPATGTPTPTITPTGYAPELNPQLVRRLPAILNDLRLLTEELKEPLQKVAIIVGELQDHLNFEVEKAALAAALAGEMDDGRRAFIEMAATTISRVDPAEVRVLPVELERLTKDLADNYAGPLARLTGSR